MKEAAGEANMTVITIVLIALVLVAGKAIVTGMMNSTAKKSCENEGGTYTSAGIFSTSFTGTCTPAGS